MKTSFAVFRSDCCLAQNPMSFVGTSNKSMAFFREEADHPDLLQLKRLCESIWGKRNDGITPAEFMIVPIRTIFREPDHWNKEGWWEGFARNNGYPKE